MVMSSWDRYAAQITNQDFQDTFLTNLLEKTSIAGEENMDVLKQELLPVLQERIMLHIYQRLDDEGRERLTTLFSTDDIEGARRFLVEHIPQYDDFLLTIYQQFEDEYVSLMSSDL